MPQIVAPSGSTTHFRGASPVPLGAAVLIEDLCHLPGDVELVDVAGRSPWAPIAVISSQTPGYRSTLQALRRIPALRGIIELEGEASSSQELLRTYFAGSAPDPDTVAAYVQGSLPNERFLRALVAEIHRHSYPARAARFEMFRKHGLLTAKGWKAVYTLTQAVSLPDRPNLDSAALQLGIDPRTLRTYSHKILDMEWRHVRNGFGWKWVVERAMQRFEVGGERKELTPCAVPVRERFRFPAGW